MAPDWLSFAAVGTAPNLGTGWKPSNITHYVISSLPSLAQSNHAQTFQSSHECHDTVHVCHNEWLHNTFWQQANAQSSVRQRSESRAGDDYLKQWRGKASLPVLDSIATFAVRDCLCQNTTQVSSSDFCVALRRVVGAQRLVESVCGSLDVQHKPKPLWALAHALFAPTMHHVYASCVCQKPSGVARAPAVAIASHRVVAGRARNAVDASATCRHKAYTRKFCTARFVQRVSESHPGSERVTCALGKVSAKRTPPGIPLPTCTLSRHRRCHTGHGRGGGSQTHPLWPSQQTVSQSHAATAYQPSPTGSTQAIALWRLSACTHLRRTRRPYAEGKLRCVTGSHICT